MGRIIERPQHPQINDLDADAIPLQSMQAVIEGVRSNAEPNRFQAVNVKFELRGVDQARYTSMCSVPLMWNEQVVGVMQNFTAALGVPQAAASRIFSLVPAAACSGTIHLIAS